MKAAREAASAPLTPWARRSPNSSTVPCSEASQMRAALVATRVWKLRMLSTTLSKSWAWISGACTRSSGSLGNTTLPSSMAKMSPVKRSVAR
jgi:hypothetical protein